MCWTKADASIVEDYGALVMRSGKDHLGKAGRPGVIGKESAKKVTVSLA